MENVMEQNVEINAFNRNEDNVEKVERPWCDDQHITLNQEQQPPVEPTYYKYPHNAAASNNFNEILTAAQWWRDTSIEDGNSQTEYYHEVTPTATYSLLQYPMDSRPSHQLEEEGDCNTQESVRSESVNKSKIIKEGREPLKRVKHPEQWKVNIKKNARLRGEEYIGVGGRIVPAKTMGPPCECRMRCTEKIDEIAREELHNIFWKTCSWEQRKQYVALSVKESPKQRTRCRGNVKSEHRRQVTFTYSLLMKGEFITVCKSMFLSTFAVSEKFVRHAMDKKRISPGGIIGPDQRGRHTPKTKKSETVKNRVRDHIKSFPTEKSINFKDCTGRRYLDSRLNIATLHKLYVSKCKEEGVPECDIVKESYYREMFKTEFNLGFKRAKIKDKKQLQDANDSKLKLTD